MGDIMTSGIDTSDPLQVAIHLARIEGTITAMQQQQGAAAEASRIAVSGMQADLRELSKAINAFNLVAHQSTAQSEQINRMFSHQKTQDEQIKKAQDAASKIFWVALGAGFVLTILMGALVFIYKGDRARMESLDTRADRMEIYLAGKRDLPFTR